MNLEGHHGLTGGLIISFVGWMRSNLFRGVSCMDQCKAQKLKRGNCPLLGCVLGVDQWNQIRKMCLRQGFATKLHHPDRAAHGLRYLLVDVLAVAMTLGVLP